MEGTTFAECSIHNGHNADDSSVLVVPAVIEQHLKGTVWISWGAAQSMHVDHSTPCFTEEIQAKEQKLPWYSIDHSWKQFIHTSALLG